jgi:hypothetical protein
LTDKYLGFTLFAWMVLRVVARSDSRLMPYNMCVLVWPQLPKQVKHILLMWKLRSSEQHLLLGCTAHRGLLVPHQHQQRQEWQQHWELLHMHMSVWQASLCPSSLWKMPAACYPQAPVVQASKQVKHVLRMSQLPSSGLPCQHMLLGCIAQR